MIDLHRMAMQLAEMPSAFANIMRLTRMPGAAYAFGPMAEHPRRSFTPPPPALDADGPGEDGE